jgi:opacity protein-like surface antigen
MLNKILLFSLLTLTLSEAKDAFSSERFLGIEVGYSTLETDNIIGNKESDSNIEYGFKIGAQNEEWRTTVALNFFQDKKKKYQQAKLSFDYFVWNSLYKTDDIVFKPYLGGHIGWMNYTNEGGNTESSGMLYGAQAGLAWNVLNEVDFDLSYKYSKTSIKDVDSLSGVVFGLNYIY